VAWAAEAAEGAAEREAARAHAAQLHARGSVLRVLLAWVRWLRAEVVARAMVRKKIYARISEDIVVDSRS
jgi:hypothetical protein